MNKIAMAVAVGGVAIGLSGASGGQQNPPSAPMTVVNTNANPVPVRGPQPLPVNGTVTVTGTTSISGTVAATQSGSWQTSIVGTPTVNVNTSNTTPLIVQGSDANTRHPLQRRLTPISGPDDDNSSVTVPDHQRYEITFVSLQGKLGSAGQDMWCRLETNGVSHWLTTNDNGFFGGFQIKVVSQPVVAYADPGSTINVACNRNIVVGSIST